jgi:ABC-2 type transport system permease protein
MSKISLILQREYLTRVRKKSFIVMTILGPLLFAAMMVVPGWLASMEDEEEKVLAVVDYTNLYTDKIQDTQLLKFKFLSRSDEQELRDNFSRSDYYAFLIIEDDLLKKPDAIRLYSEAQITMDVKEHVSRSLRQYLSAEKLKTFEIAGLDSIMAEMDKVGVDISTIKLGDDGTEKQSSTEVAMIVSFIFAFMSYMFVFIYGAQVMRGVMEEKTSRIIEVIVSSVKPFQLMMGKIIGIALVALTQFLLWIALTALILFVVKTIFVPDMPLNKMEQMEMAGSESMQVQAANNFDFGKVLEMVNSIEPVKLLLMFVFYFIGGYLIYAALFAAVGAAIDNETDSQQFMLPITIPIILALYVAMAVFRNPNSDMAFWFSMIPLTSPVVMMARAPFDVPGWQIALSMFLLVAGFIFTTWFAARIYRVGILMYGKKVSYKELWKWFLYAGK